jgi:hypothetical protein
MTVRTERELKIVAARDTLRTALTIPLPGEMTYGSVLASRQKHLL